MNWVDTGFCAGGWIAVLGIVKYLVSSKVNKAECNLIHSSLQEDITEIKKNLKDISKTVNKINIKLAVINGVSKKTGLIIDE